MVIALVYFFGPRRDVFSTKGKEGLGGKQQRPMGKFFLKKTSVDMDANVVFF